MGSERLALRSAALILIIGILGLPINDLASYGVLVAAALAILTGTMSTRPARWAWAALAAALVVATPLAWPAPRIAEGHNVFLPGPRMAETSGLPSDVLRVLSRQFDEEYPPEKRCDDPARGCWRPERPPQADGFAFSADAVLDRAGPSRRVASIAFSDPAYLRLGFINDYIYGWADDASDIKRFERDRRSLNLFDRYRVTFPLFVIYRFPPAFVGSTLCWHGTVLWEGSGEQFETLATLPSPASGGELGRAQCREIAAPDAERRIVGVSIKRDVRLAMTLAPTARLQMRRGVDAVLTLLGGIAVVLLLVHISWRRLALPALLIGLGLLVAMFIDAQFIGGMRPFDSGDDGIVYEGFGRAIVQNALAGDIAAALRGVEAVYHFTPGLRYVRALELVVFGETSLLYLSAILLLPLLVFALFRRFLPIRWAVVLVLVFAAVPIGALFGSSLFQYVMWASRGYSDPFAVVLLLCATTLIIPPGTRESGWPRTFAAGLLFAAATFCRPNLVLASATMVGGAAAMAMVRRRWALAGAAMAGFGMLVVSPLHNYVYGHAFVLFSDIVGDMLRMSPLDYAKALLELLRLDLGGDHLRAAIAQLGGWLAGPSELLAMVPIHAFAVAVLVRVGIFGTSYDPWLRLVALATLLQHGIGASYFNFARYNLGTWLLTLLVLAVWLEREGLASLCRTVPGWCRACRSSAAVERLARALDAGVAAFGLADSQQGMRQICPKTGIIKQSLNLP